MTAPDDFCVLILTHGRPHNQKTITALEKHGYTGPWFLVVDDEDPTTDELRAIYGDERVVEFNRDEMASLFDEGFNFRPGERSGVVYARAAAHTIAADLGFRWFIQLDDDYERFEYRFDDHLVPTSKAIRSLDVIWGLMLDWFQSMPPEVVTIAMGQGGDYLGGPAANQVNAVKVKRKAMNSFLCDTHRPFMFPGRLNEDVNAYTREQRAGQVMATVLQVSLEQETTQAGEGGMVEIYLDEGTYVKSFYSVMHCPSAVQVVPMYAAKYQRLHHRVNYRACAPKILAAHHRKDR